MLPRKAVTRVCERQAKYLFKSCDSFPNGVLSTNRDVAASIAFSIRHKFEPGFPCLSHSFCLLCFDVPSFRVVSRAPPPLLIDLR